MTMIGSSQPFLGYGRQSIAAEDVDAVIAALRSDYLTQGPAVERFEAALAEYVGASHAVAVSSGTAALHIACLAAGLCAGQRALTQAITFVATANAALYCNAGLDAIDIDPDTLGMDADSLRRALARKSETRVVLPVHMSGYAAAPAAIRQASHGRIVIEDACHALGAREPDGAMVGSCRHSDMACFSFHPVKSITTGEGGAVTTNDAELARVLRMLRSHGIEREANRLTLSDQGFDQDQTNPWYYEQQALGFNYRITDLGAALGSAQLQRIDQFIERRRAVARTYDAALTGLSHLKPLQAGADARQRSSLHLYLVDIDFAALRKSRRTVMGELRQRGIGTQVHYIPLYRQPMHLSIGKPEQFPNAERYYRGCLSIPLYPSLTDENVERVVKTLREVVAC